SGAGPRGGAPVLPVSVGNALAGVPPRRSVRGGLPHTAPTSGAWRRNGRSDLGAGPEPGETRSRRSARTVPTTSEAAGSDAEAREANCGPPPVERCSTIRQRAKDPTLPDSAAPVRPGATVASFWSVPSS